jgi:phage terminase small subunit
MRIYCDDEGIMLTHRQSRFVFEYMKDFVASKAYIRAGYSESGAGSGGCKLLENPEILAAIEEQREVLASVACLTPEWVLHQWMQIAAADPSDIVAVVQRRCENCWAIPDAGLPPNPACETCHGDGVKHVRITDTRSLKGGARLLYNGAVQTRDGIKVLLRDREAALKNLADYLGMLNKSKGELSGPGGGPIPLAAALVTDLTDAQLMAIAAAGLPGLTDNLGVDQGVSQGMLDASTTIEGT